jgi:hypothetical protein
MGRPGLEPGTNAFDWEQVNNWLLQFRRHRIAVILIHHAGRNGEARGTSKREGATFWVIALNDAKKQAEDRTGARFVSLFTKPSRNTHEDVPAYEWGVTTDATTGAVEITCKPAQSLDVFRRCLEEGLSDNRQIAEEMRISPGQVSKLFKKARDQGWAEKDGRDYALVGDTSIGNEAL